MSEVRLGRAGRTRHPAGKPPRGPGEGAPRPPSGRGAIWNALNLSGRLGGGRGRGRAALHTRVLERPPGASGAWERGPPAPSVRVRVRRRGGGAGQTKTRPRQGPATQLPGEGTTHEGAGASPAPAGTADRRPGAHGAAPEDNPLRRELSTRAAFQPCPPRRGRSGPPRGLPTPAAPEATSRRPRPLTPTHLERRPGSGQAATRGTSGARPSCPGP